MEHSPVMRQRITENLKSLLPARRKFLQRKLIDWYKFNCRQLPWRRSRDPYIVWVSEVMLQQTQVQTVIPYFIRFIKSYPTITDLAFADIHHLLKAWAGLGYYSRPKNLQKAARLLVKKHGGNFPKNYEQVMGLPGIGRYTAAAVLSIAFDQSYVALDGNVIRVLTRFFRLRGDPAKAALQKILIATGQKLLPNKGSGEFNQALMELGATICSPRSPSCFLCPWQSDCGARQAGIPELFPEKGRRLDIRLSQQAAAVICHRGRVLIRQRTQTRLLQGMWEFPGGEFNQKNLRRSLVNQVKRKLGLTICLVAPLTKIKHTVTNRRITLEVYWARPQLPIPTHLRKQGARWIFLNHADRYPLTAAASRIVEALMLQR